jgi:catechol 2,3-dioxygenase-like lactoylglutathione lyase family enzyme
MATAFALDHLVLVVSDVERALAWYREHAGLGPVRLEEWRRGEVPFPSLRVDDHTIIDVLAGELEGNGRLDHICFVVSSDDLDSLKRNPALEIVDEGVRFGARGDGRSIYVRDPDGLTVEFRSSPA